MNSEVFQRRPKTSEVFRSLSMRINAGSLPVLFPSKIRDREEGIVLYSFYTWFSFLTWVWVNIFLEIVSNKTATTHIFLSGVRNWPASVSRCEIEVFNPQAWDSHLRRESWQVYAMFKFVDHNICGIDLVGSSTAYRQNNIHKTTHWKGHCKAFYMSTQHRFWVLSK